LSIYDMGQEEADDEDNVGILFFHGSPDAPTVDVVTGGSPLIDDASFGDFQGYLNVPAASYDLDITPGNDNSTIVASYRADLSFWGGNTAVIFASGFLSGNDPAFEPWVALNNGGTFPLTALPNSPNPTPPGIVNNNSANSFAAFKVQPNPAVNNLDVSFKLEKESPVMITVVNQLGQVVKELVVAEIGTDAIQLQVGQLASGAYHLTIVANGQFITTEQVRIQKY